MSLPPSSRRAASGGIEDGPPANTAPGLCPDGCTGTSRTPRRSTRERRGPGARVPPMHYLDKPSWCRASGQSSFEPGSSSHCRKGSTSGRRLTGVMAACNPGERRPALRPRRSRPQPRRPILRHRPSRRRRQPRAVGRPPPAPVRFGSTPPARSTIAPAPDGTARPRPARTCPRRRPRPRGRDQTTEKLADRNGAPIVSRFH
jgi:hypothetical protein